MPRRGENIRKRKDGRWEARVIQKYDFTGKAQYVSIYGKTYFEVKEKRANYWENLPQACRRVPEREITFRECLFLWLDNNRIKIKEQTYAKYLYLINTHIIPMLGDMKIKRVESLTINRFLLEKSRSGRLDGSGGLSASYLQTIYFIVHACLEFAVREGMRSNMCGEITKPIKKEASAKLEILSVQEQSILVRHLLCSQQEQNIGILISLYMGLRIGEVCGLRWQDIDLTERVFHIRHTVERITNFDSRDSERKTRLVLCTTKSISSDRVIPIPSNILALLVKFKEQDGFVVKGKTYEYADPRTYQNRFHKCLTECGLRHINYHALRHTFATRCMEAGMDTKTLSELLGHANVHITLNTYVHSSLAHKRKQIELLNSICGQ